MKREEKKSIRDFIKRWSGYHKEDEDARSFLIELFEDVLCSNFATKRINFEKKVRIKGHVKRIDAYIPETRTLIEMKSSNVDLNHTGRTDYETAFDQAKTYYDNLRMSERGRYIICSNFQTIEIHDMENPDQEPVVIQLSNLEKDYKKLDILINPERVNPEAEKIRIEQELSVKAGALVGELYNLFLKQFGDHVNEQQLKDLNILIVRIVFCLYAEDSGLFNSNQFHDFIKSYAYQNVNRGLEDLFEVLDTPENDRIPAYLTPELMAFPYVNGGLFAVKIRIPRFTPEITKNILEAMSEQFDWSGISPTIFGAVFESTLNPDTRRSGGMHYTSVENIHKVIDPLFLDDLKAELEEIRSLKQDKIRNRRLEAFQEKLGNLKFLDPACGSGNFLTEAYLSLRKLENEALSLQMKSGQIRMNFDVIKVHIQQFYGIEINDFAVSVATTALYIAEAQMFEETQKIVYSTMQFLPLHSYSNIVEGNSLTMDWNSVVPKSELSFIMGNPPFLGYSLQTSNQKKDLISIYTDQQGRPYKNSGKIDYVAGWFFKSAQMIYNTKIRVALVATNSITQGDQVSPVWKPIFQHFNIHIDFAYQTFVWSNSSNQMAHVHVVIIGFSYEKPASCYLYTKNGKISVQTINPYLVDGPIVYIEKRSFPLQKDTKKMSTGNRPADGGNFFLSEQEKSNVLYAEPDLKQYIHRVIGSEEFIKGKVRYCFWLQDVSPSVLSKSSILKKRLKNIEEIRSSSTKEATRKAAKTPWLFQEIRQPDSNYLVIPETSSERRQYIPIGFMDCSVIGTNSIQLIPNATPYEFGLITSSVHMAWMRIVAGRLEMRYRYSKNIVYNNFPWPDPSPQQKARIKQTAQAILDARANHPGSSLADLYDPLLMPSDLRKAHEANDKAVKEAYGMPKNISEPEIVAWLMKLYKKITANEM